MVKMVLNTPSLEDKPILPNEIEQKNLQHVSRKQKLLIESNLKKLKSVLLIRIEGTALSFVDIKNLRIKAAPKLEQVLLENDYDELIELTTNSILTPPEKDRHFADRVSILAMLLTVTVLRNVKIGMEQINARKEEEDRKNNKKSKKNKKNADTVKDREVVVSSSSS